MKITRPLDHDELVDSHLSSDQRQLESQLAGLADWARDQADWPEEFWLRQRAQIRARIAQSEFAARARPVRLAWATISAVILIAAILLNTAPKPNSPPSHVDPDHELLVEVEQALRTDGPEALEPVALIVREISQADKSDSLSSRHANRRNHED
jgi:hypothetical protein